MKKRRAPWGKVPAYARANGFSADLIHAVGAAAMEHRQPVTYLKKNGETYIAIRIPTPDELAVVDAATDAATDSKGDTR